MIKKLLSVTFALFILSGCTGVSSSNPTSSTAATTLAATSAGVVTTTSTSASLGTEATMATTAKEAQFIGYEAGMYKIGTDMPAGEYKLFANETFFGLSYFSVSKDSSGSLSSIIANDNYPNFTYVTVKDGQYFEFSNAYAVHVDVIDPYEASDNKYIPGMYKVGFDIPAGEYKLIYDGDSMYAYFARMSDSTHTIYSIIANDNFDTDKYVTVNSGEYFAFTGCYINK